MRAFHSRVNKSGNDSVREYVVSPELHAPLLEPPEADVSYVWTAVVLQRADGSLHR